MNPPRIGSPPTAGTSAAPQSMTVDSPPTPPTPRSKRIVELDALRALAAINLMLFHFTYLYQVKYGFSQPLGIMYPFGKYGVQLFFMLSGLVNAMTLLRKGRGDDFLAARLIRIAPPFWAALALNALLVAWMPLAAAPPTTGQWLANLTIVPNFWGADCIEPVTWTLQIELFFYGWILLWFLSGWLQRPLRTVAWMMAAVLVVQFPLTHGWIDPHTTWGTVLTGLSTTLIAPHLPLFWIGMLIYEIYRRRQAGESFRAHGNLGVAILLCAIVFHAVDERGHNPLATVVFAVALGLAVAGRIPLLRAPVFVFISSISYALYLLHNNLGTTLIYQLDPQIGPWPALLVSTGMVVVVAYVSTHYFELPLSSYLRGRWNAFKTSRRTRFATTPTTATHR